MTAPCIRTQIRGYQLINCPVIQGHIAGSWVIALAFKRIQRLPNNDTTTIMLILLLLLLMRLLLVPGYAFSAFPTICTPRDSQLFSLLLLLLLLNIMIMIWRDCQLFPIQELSRTAPTGRSNQGGGAGCLYLCLMSLIRNRRYAIYAAACASAPDCSSAPSAATLPGGICREGDPNESGGDSSSSGHSGNSGNSRSSSSSSPSAVFLQHILYPSTRVRMLRAHTAHTLSRARAQHTLLSTGTGQHTAHGTYTSTPTLAPHV